MINSKLKSLVFPLVAMAALSACSQTTQTSSSYGAPENIKVCSGYGCILSDKFQFTEDDKAKLTVIMEAGKTSPQAERDAVMKAVATMETMARGHLRYRPDVKLSYQKNAGKRGQMDCIDESLNTISYLTYLKSVGLLRHHTPHKRFAERGILFDGRYPHKTATMKANDGEQWAVDSWKGNDGASPEIMTLKEWYRSRASS